LLFGLRALGSAIRITGVCVRRDVKRQRIRISDACEGIATLLEAESKVTDDDINLTDAFLAPGYGVPNEASSMAIVLGAQTEGLLLDPVYTGKAMAGLIHHAKSADDSCTFIFLHTGGLPAIFGYQKVIEEALSQFDGASDDAVGTE
jgi:1-aminocyclopropane-1-carboxylate deaminase/D-cysteine desulfhydrase-like pyridoxal-dependent ACC family enzyme